MDLAVKKVRRTVKADKKIKKARNRARKEGAETLNGMTQVLCVPFRDAVKGYGYELRNLHPFEEVVADMTVRSRRSKDGVDLQTVLQGLHEARVDLRGRKGLGSLRLRTHRQPWKPPKLQPPDNVRFWTCSNN